MNLILFTASDFISADMVRVRNRRFRHLVSVNNARVNDTFKCGMINGKIGTSIVTKIDDSAIEMKIQALDQEPPAPLPLTLVLALPRPKMIRRIIENTTSMGVKKIYLINSWRVEKSFWQSPVLQTESLETSMHAGLEQSCDTRMPVIYLKKLFAPFVNKELPELAANTLKLVAHPKTDQPCPWNIDQPATLVVGPEGGFIDKEIQTFEKFKFIICSMGPRILKVETAVNALVSRLYK